MRSRIWGTWVVVACALFAFASNAEAANITSLIDFDPTGDTTNQISDDSVENIINVVGSPLTLDVGDFVEGILNITALGDEDNTLKTIGSGTSNNELTAIFRTKVIKKTFSNAGLDGIVGTPDDQYTIAFGPDDTWAAAAALGVAGGAGTGTGAMVIFFEDSAQNFTKSGPTGTDWANASDGKYFWALGFNTAVPAGANFNATTGEGWVATSRDTVPSTNIQIGTAVYALNRVFSTNAPSGTTPIPGIGEGYVLALQAGQFSDAVDGSDYVEIRGSTSFNAQLGSSSGWNVNNQAEFFIVPLSVVPLPAAAWAGLALLGALGIGRRLRRRS